jgi:hypothetical protein
VPVFYLYSDGVQWRWKPSGARKVKTMVRRATALFVTIAVLAGSAPALRAQPVDADSERVPIRNAFDTSRDAAGAHAVAKRLYPGISPEQDSLARRALSFFFSFQWADAEKTGRSLQRLEQKHRLPPVSCLLLLGMRVLRIQNGEYENDAARRDLLKDIGSLARAAFTYGKVENFPDSCAATNLFLTGGVKGFVATLDMDKNPLGAAINGLQARELLSRALARDSSIFDAYLGLGLFDCVLAAAPPIVRDAAALGGFAVTREKGLAYLRRSAGNGGYTADVSRLYLIEFLSPYFGDEAQEKDNLLQTFERKYPHNPYYVFLRLDEDLCFHHDTLKSFSFAQRLAEQMEAFVPSTYSARRYAQLVAWQRLLIEPFPTPGSLPDSTFNLAGFSYYPVFLRALREKLLFEEEPVANRGDRSRRALFVKQEGERARRMLESSAAIPAGQKARFLWHIRDALRVEPAPPR